MDGGARLRALRRRYPQSMATVAPRPVWRLRARTVRAAPVLAPLALGALVAVSLLLRIRELGVGFWIDEGISVGIADRPLLDIPGTLLLDGSPPLYYMLLHVWMQVAGMSEQATHGLSVACALLTVPVAWWGARAALGARTGWFAAVLAALNPFLTQYAQETRMYALVVLLGLLATSCFLCAFAVPEPARPDRRWAAGLAVSLIAIMYTHNWALFFTGALVVAFAVLVVLAPRHDRVALVKGGLIGFVPAALLYLPWVPSLLSQMRSTGAPWSTAPDLADLATVPALLLGPVAVVALLLAAGSGAVALLGRRTGRRLGPEARVVLVLLVVAVVTVLLAYAASHVSPAWAARYLGVALPPLLLLSAAGLAAAGRLGVVGLVLVALMWAGDRAPTHKSNVRDIAASVAPGLRPGDLVVATQPEQVPVLHYYLPPGLRYATLTGPVKDLGVTDWRDGVERLRASSARRDLEPLIAGLEPGRRLVLVEPQTRIVSHWSAPWTQLIRLRSREWNEFATSDPRVRVGAIYPARTFPERRHPLRATVLVRTSGP